MKHKSLMTFVAAMVLLTGCGEQADNHAGHTHVRVNGDLQETTASIHKLPTFLDGLHDNIGQVYALAGEHAVLLDSMPCYCGCGSSAGHRSNKNCFIQSIAEDGTVVWDDHGTRCAVCMEIVVLSAKLKAEGKSDLEIRQFIDETYKEGYAPPTPTPMPS